MGCRFFKATIALSFFVSLTESLECKQSAEVAVVSTDHCLYIRSGIAAMSRETAENECRLLGENGFDWFLPVIDSDEDNNNIPKFIKNITGLTNWIMWIGLQRDPPSGVLEALNMTAWADKFKWRWTVDRATLDMSFRNTDPPWYKEWKEPNNYPFVNSRQAKDLERCAVVEYVPERNPSPQWFDTCCDIISANHLLQDRSEKFVLVCESAIFDTPGMNGPIRTLKDNDSDFGNNDSNNVDNLKWKWLFGVTMFSFLVSALTFGVWQFLKWRKSNIQREGVMISCRNSEDVAGSRAWMIDTTD